MDYYKKTDEKIIIYEGVVYDVADYVGLHPGGKDFIEDYYGTSIDVKFEEQGHSRAAKKLFKQFPVVGTVLGLTKAQKPADHTGLEGSKLESKLKVDFTKGVFNQLGNRDDYTFEDYVQFINEPKQLINPVRDVRVFDQGFFEAFSKTPWYAIPIFYFPQISYLVYSSFSQGADEYMAAICFGIGMVIWSFMEYMIHRFFFHSEDYWLPENRKILALHWVIHGIHHTFPQEKLRLVFPIVPGIVVLNSFLTLPIYTVMPA